TATTATAAPASCPASDLPGRDRVALPPLIASRRRRVTEMQQAGLSPGVCFDLERALILPGDVQTTWHAHDRGRAIGLAGVPFALVLHGIPCVCEPATLVADRHAGVVAFRGSDHAPAPIL